MRLRTSLGLAISIFAITESPALAGEVTGNASLRQPALVLPAPAAPWHAETIEHLPARLGETAPSRDVCNHCQPGNRIAQRWHTTTKPKLQQSHWGYPEYFHVRPYGSYTRGALTTQIVNGWGAQMTLYHYDFLDLNGEPSDRLSERGLVQLRRIVELLPFADCAIVIEITPGQAELDAARRDQVLAELQQAGIPIPDERVVVGKPAARGLDAWEGVPLYFNAVQNFSAGAASGASINPASGPRAGVGAGPSPALPTSR